MKRKQKIKERKIKKASQSILRKSKQTIGIIESQSQREIKSTIGYDVTKRMMLVLVPMYLKRIINRAKRKD